MTDVGPEPAAHAAMPRPYVPVESVELVDPQVALLRAELAATQRLVAALTVERDQLSTAVEQLRGKLRERPTPPASPGPGFVVVSVAELATHRGISARAWDVAEGRSDRFRNPMHRMVGRHIAEGGTR